MVDMNKEVQDNKKRKKKNSFRKWTKKSIKNKNSEMRN